MIIKFITLKGRSKALSYLTLPKSNARRMPLDEDK